MITLDFVNRYSASTTFAGIEVAKTMYGKDLEDKQFGFTLEPVDPASAQKMLDRGLPADEEQLERIFAAGEAPEGEPHLMEKLKGLKFTQADAGRRIRIGLRRMSIPHGMRTARRPAFRPMA